MNITNMGLFGVRLIEPDVYVDERGSFRKTFHLDTFHKFGMGIFFAESFCSTNKKDVIRGMHMQDTEKVVYVTSGKVLDVVLDPDTGRCVTTQLSAENGKVMYIPKQYAHGFLSLEDNTTMVYLQTRMYDATRETGIRYDSFGFKWPVKKPIVSQRDMQLPRR